LTLTPAKLENRLYNIATGARPPIDGDVKCIFELQQRLKKFQPKDEADEEVKETKSEMFIQEQYDDTEGS
jgi:hypothetical protein